MGNVLAGGCCSKDEEDEANRNKEPIISGPNIKPELDFPATTIDTKDFTKTDLPEFKNNIIEKNEEKNEDKNEEKKENVYDKYQQLDRLGEGSFGKVFKVKNKNTGEFFVVKEINKSALLNNNKKNKVSKEIVNLKNINNINIIKISDFFEDANNYYIVNELCDNGNLEKYAKNGLNFCEFIVKFIMYKVLQAVDYLHKLNVTHGNIKRSNIGIIKKNSDNDTPSIKDLINEISRNEKMEQELLNISKISNLSIESKKFLKNLSHYELKLLDFGTSEIFKLRNNDEILLITGTLGYLAPEIFSGKDNMQKDEWACGILMYSLLTGIIPFDGNTKEEIINEIKNKNIDMFSNNLKQKSKICRDLITKLLTRNPKLRIKADEALNHEFFKNGILINDINEKIDISENIELSNLDKNFTFDADDKKNIIIKKEVKIIEPTVNDIITGNNNLNKIEVKKVEITVEKIITNEPVKINDKKEEKINEKKEEKTDEKKEEAKPLYKRRLLDEKKEEPKEEIKKEVKVIVEIKKEEPKKEEKENEKPTEGRKNYSYRRNRANQEPEKKEEEPKKEEENNSKQNTYNRRRRGLDTEKKEEEPKKEEKKEEENSSKQNTYNRRRRNLDSEKKDEEPKKEEENNSKQNTYNRRRRGADTEKKEEEIKTVINPGAANKIKKEIIDHITTTQINRRTIYRFKDVIEQLCKGDTKMQIDKNSFSESFKRAFKDFTDDEVNKLFDDIKDKKSGKVDCKTLIDTFSTREKLLNDSVIKRAFNAFDVSGSGSITWDKVFATVFRSKKDKENDFNIFIKELGYKNKNDKVSLNEFIKALK